MLFYTLMTFQTYDNLSGYNIINHKSCLICE